MTEAIAPSAQIEAALAAHPGATVTAYKPPADAGASARIELTTADGAERSVFVDPGNGRVLGEMDPFWQLSELAVKIHGTLLIGMWGDRIVELAACWCLLMVVSGVYLWWPCGQRFTLWGTLLPRLRAEGRTFWRDLHAVSGIWTAAVIGFLVITGLPWAGFWGDKLCTAAGWIGQSYPVALWADVPASTPLMKEVVDDPGWTLQGAPVTASTPGREGTAPTIDTVVALATERGVPAGYTVSYPKSETGVWTITSWTDQRWDSVTLHIDRWSGAILADIPFDSFGGVAKAVEYGIVRHEGRFFGLANQLIMPAAAPAARPAAGGAAAAGRSAADARADRPDRRLGRPVPAARAVADRGGGARSARPAPRPGAAPGVRLRRRGPPRSPGTALPPPSPAMPLNARRHPRRRDRSANARTAPRRPWPRPRPGASGRAC